MKVLIRVDASAKIGSGHLIRCRSLARSLRSIGSDVCFCGRISDLRLRQSLSREFRIFELSLDDIGLINPSIGVWLPVSELDDASQTAGVLNGIEFWKPDWLVVDHYGLSAEWQKQMRLLVPNIKIAVVDDLANRFHDPDLLIDHNTFHGDLAARYLNLLPQSREIHFCLGPQFALIDPFHAVFNESLPPRTRLRKVLISLGGAGDTKLLEKILHAIKALPEIVLQVQLVQGAFAADSQHIQDLCDELDVQRFSSLSSLAPLMAGADVAVGAGGTTTWERLCLGIPTITYSLAANQEVYSQVLAEKNLIEYLGSADTFSTAEFQATLMRWYQDPSHLFQQSSAGMALVDGRGCDRVARLMMASLEPDYLPTPDTSIQGDLSVRFAWPDGLALITQVCEESQNGDFKKVLPCPFRLIDLLEISRRLFKPVSGFLCSFNNSHCADAFRVTIISSKGSWMNHYIPQLLLEASGLGCSLRWIHDHRALQEGDISLLLSYGRIVSEEWLALSMHNLVVHASALPLGKGWSPMTWQIVEGASEIPITLFEADTELDAGHIYDQQHIQLSGFELSAEWQEMQALATLSLCMRWLADYPHSATLGKPQEGEESVYPRRTPEDSRLDPTRTLEELLPLLRVVDNQAYPAFFEIDGTRYKLSIEPLIK